MYWAKSCWISMTINRGNDDVSLKQLWYVFFFISSRKHKSFPSSDCTDVRWPASHSRLPLQIKRYQQYQQVPPTQPVFTSCFLSCSTTGLPVTIVIVMLLKRSLHCQPWNNNSHLGLHNGGRKLHYTLITLPNDLLVRDDTVWINSWNVISSQSHNILHE